MELRNKLIELLQKSDALSYEPNAYPVDLYAHQQKVKWYVSENDGHLTIDYGKLADDILNSKLFSNFETLAEQSPHIYRWTAVEDDGYTHSEAGAANNMLDAFIKATEYSPSYHKKIVIEKISDDELTDEEKELKEFWTNA